MVRVTLVLGFGYGEQFVTQWLGAPDEDIQVVALRKAVGVLGIFGRSAWEKRSGSWESRCSLRNVRGLGKLVEALGKAVEETGIAIAPRLLGNCGRG